MHAKITEIKKITDSHRKFLEILFDGKFSTEQFSLMQIFPDGQSELVLQFPPAFVLHCPLMQKYPWLQSESNRHCSVGIMHLASLQTLFSLQSVSVLHADVPGEQVPFVQDCPGGQSSLLEHEEVWIICLHSSLCLTSTLLIFPFESTVILFVQDKILRAGHDGFSCIVTAPLHEGKKHSRCSNSPGSIILSFRSEAS